MSDKITITKKMWDRWMKSYCLEPEDEYWNGLVLESQKREPIERWAVVLNDRFITSYDSKEDANNEANIRNGHVIHMREVESGE